MNTATNSLIQNHWLEGEIVGINCLARNNGAVTLLTIYTVASETEKNHYVFPLADTTVTSLEGYNDDIWTEVQAHPVSLTVGDLQVFCGEGGMGNEGFVAAQDINGLVWSLFSTESNPFVKMELINRILSVHSDLCIYKINMDNLTDIKVTILPV
ncbi:MAG: hypothetical protein EOO55_03780 [Hymenobacter sp.]|nr:MAG: hypothetical protein EOO55_03780 [Hymenobacter sp.]